MGIVSAVLENHQNERNLAEQNKWNAINRSWQLQDMAHQEMREDSSYQRTMADLRKAGLSASALSGLDGSGAVPTVSGTASQGIAPNVDGTFDSLANFGLGLTSAIQSKKDREQSESQFGRGLALSYEQLAHQVSDDKEKNRLQGIANQISDEANKIMRDQADEQARKNKEQEYDSYMEQVNNLIETGTYSAVKSSSGLNLMGSGVNSDAFKGTPWKNYGYDTADVQNIANGRRDYGQLKVMYDGDIPVFVTTKPVNKAGEYKYYNVSKGTWNIYKPDNPNYKQLNNKPPKAMKMNPDGTVTNSSGDYSNPMTN